MLNYKRYDFFLNGHPIPGDWKIGNPIQTNDENDEHDKNDEHL